MCFKKIQKEACCVTCVTTSFEISPAALAKGQRLVQWVPDGSRRRRLQVSPQKEAARLLHQAPWRSPTPSKQDISMTFRWNFNEISIGFVPLESFRSLLVELLHWDTALQGVHCPGSLARRSFQERNLLPDWQFRLDLSQGEKDLRWPWPRRWFEKVQAQLLRLQRRFKLLTYLLAFFLTALLTYVFPCLLTYLLT